MIPPFPGSPPASAPVDCPPVGGSIAVACARELNAACMVFDYGPGVTIIETYRFLRFDRDSGCVVDGALHAKPSSHRSQHDPE